MADQDLRSAPGEVVRRNGKADTGAPGAGTGGEALRGLLTSTARFMFFTGKGGVGKTSTAAASAIALADSGARVLLVSTDPASNLDEVLDTALGATPTSIKDVPGLDAMNIDPVAVAATYRERVVGPYRDLLPASAVASIEEQLSGACTVEIAAFDEFTALLADPAATEAYDRVLFDTAPTGHTLRLLSLPEAWSSFIDTNTLGTSCIGPLSGLSAQQDRYRVALRTLANPAQTLLVMVARPDPLSLAEAARAAGELGKLGIANQRLVLNGIFQSSDPDDPLAMSLAASSAAAVAALPGILADLDRDEVPLVPWSLVGIGGLRALMGGSPPPPIPEPCVALPRTATFSDLVDELENRGRGLVLTMGKGGVGKTTIAAVVALELARRGCAVELTTTDPAAHLEAVLASDEASMLGGSR